MTCEWVILFFVSDKRVFVVPTFESKQKLSPLLTKQELLELWDSGSVQPFYYQACWKCQQNLDFDAWKRYFCSCVYLTLCLKFLAVFPSSTKTAALTVISHTGLFSCCPFFCQYSAFYWISECFQNLVNTSWSWRIKLTYLNKSETQKYFEWIFMNWFMNGKRLSLYN